MRRTELNVAEKRILKSTGKSLSLIRTYDKLNLEKRSFVSTSQFDKRVFLNKYGQCKPAPRSGEHGNVYSKYFAKNKFPQISGSTTQVDTSANSHPKTSTGNNKLLHSQQRREHRDFGMSQLIDKKYDQQSTKITSGGRQVNNSEKSSLETLKPALKSHRKTRNSFANLIQCSDNQLKYTDNDSCVIGVNDIITYRDNERKERSNENRTAMENKKNSSDFPHEIIPAKPSRTVQNNSPSRQQKSKRTPKLSVNSQNKPTDTNAASERTDEDSNHSLSNGAPPHKSNTDSSMTPGEATVTKSISKNPWSTVSRQLPSLGKLRTASFFDIKAFTQGRVLDLLSAEEPTERNKKYLNVEKEELRYCKYLRSSATENDQEDLDDIPMKYRPSKNIIIGHTKISSLL